MRVTRSRTELPALVDAQAVTADGRPAAAGAVEASGIVVPGSFAEDAETRVAVHTICARHLEGRSATSTDSSWDAESARQVALSKATQTDLAKAAQIGWTEAAQTRGEEARKIAPIAGVDVARRRALAELEGARLDALMRSWI